MARNIYDIDTHSKVLCLIAKGKTTKEIINIENHELIIKHKEKDIKPKPIYNSQKWLREKGLIKVTKEIRNRYEGTRKEYGIVEKNIILDIYNLLLKDIDISMLPFAFDIEIDIKNEIKCSVINIFLNEFLSETKNYNNGLKNLYQMFLLYVWKMFKENYDRINYSSDMNETLQIIGKNMPIKEYNNFDTYFIMKANMYVLTKGKITF